MMKIFLKTGLILFLLGVSVLANSQNKVAVFGVRTGINLAGFDGVDNSKTRVGFNLGVTADFRLSDYIYLLMGLEYTAKGAKGELYTESLGLTYKSTDKPAYLQMPIHVGYLWAINRDFRLMFHGGPFIAYGLGGKKNQEYIYDTRVDREDIDFFGIGVGKFDFGLGAGVNVEYDRYVLGLGYDRGLKNFAPDYNDGKGRTRNIYITLGYLF